MMFVSRIVKKLHPLMIIAVILVQSSLMPLLQIGDVTPNLLAVFLVFEVNRRGRAWGIAMGFAGGLLWDLFTASLLGVSSLGFALSAYLIGFLPWSRHGNNPGLLMAGMAMMVAIFSVTRYLLSGMNMTANFGIMLIRYWIPGMIYTLFFGLITFFLVEAVRRRRK